MDLSGILEGDQTTYLRTGCRMKGKEGFWVFFFFARRWGLQALKWVDGSHIPRQAILRTEELGGKGREELMVPFHRFKQNKWRCLVDSWLSTFRTQGEV